MLIPLLQPLSLLLKTSSLIDELALYDVVNTPGVAADLSHISSKAVRLSLFTADYRTSADKSLLLQKITGYLPKDDGAKAAVKDADIIVIPAGIPRTILLPRQVMAEQKTKTLLQASLA